MFDPAQSAALREPGPDEPMLAPVAALKTIQREALVNLLCGSARRLPGRRGRWVVAALGTSWEMHPRTIEVLAAQSLVTLISGARATLTPRGLWYARSAVYEARSGDRNSRE